MKKSLLLLSIGMCAATGALSTDATAATVKDFSKGANTFIVTEAGEYSFPTAKVDGTAIAAESADWIWSHSETDNSVSIIDNVEWADGKVSFTASGAKGNAVIAAFDGSGTVVWTWLVWSAGEVPSTMEFENGSVFQDRYLGAPSPESATAICYQFGRNTPIYMGYTNSDNNLPMENAQKQTLINPKHSFGWQCETTTPASTIEEAIANPTTFYATEDVKWTEPDVNDLWNPTNGKTNYDPCPEGYQMPVRTDYSNFLWENTDISLVDFVRIEYTHNGQTALFPNLPSINYTDGITDDYGNLILFIGESYAMEIMPGIPWGDPAPGRFMVSLNPDSYKFDFIAQANPTFGFGVRCVADGSETGNGGIAAIAEHNEFTVKQSGDKLEMLFNNGLFSTATLADMSGRVIARQEIGASEVEATLSTSGLQKGFYIVTAAGNGKSVSKKVIIR